MRRLGIVVILAFVVMFTGCVTCPQTPDISACFSPNHCSVDLIKDIDGAGVSLDCMIYSLTSKDIVEAIYRAKSRGVTIRIIADKIQSAGRYSQIDELLAKGYKVKIMRGAHGGIMHNKVLIIDNVVLYTGSYNFTKGAEENNYENLIRITNSDIIKKYKAEMEKLWAK